MFFWHKDISDIQTTPSVVYPICPYVKKKHKFIRKNPGISWHLARHLNWEKCGIFFYRAASFFYDWETPLMSAIRHCFLQTVSRTRYSYTYVTWYMTSKNSKACVGEPEIDQVFMPRGVFRFICQVQSCVFRTEH